MDPTRFDSLTRLFASRLSRRAAITGAAAGLLAAVGLHQGAGAQVTQAYCGNKSCRTNPGRCNDGCVCCVWPNKNSRCMPPGRCTGLEVGGTTTAPTTTTTSTTTSTTAAPTCVDTGCTDGLTCCAANGDGAACRDLDIDTANCGACGNACSGETTYCVDGACVECRNSDDCIDGIACTDDICNQQTGRCEHLPIPDLCAPSEACVIGVCDPPNGDPVSGCVFSPTVCPDDGFTCTRNVCDPQFNQCVTIPDSSLCSSDDACFSAVCVPEIGDPTTGCILQPNSCDDHIACTVDTCFDGVCSHTKDSSLCPPPNPLVLEYCLTPLCDPENGNSETGCRFVDTCNVNGVLDPGCRGCQQCSCQAILASPGVYEGRCVPSCEV